MASATVLLQNFNCLNLKFKRLIILQLFSYEHIFFVHVYFVFYPYASYIACEKSSLLLPRLHLLYNTASADFLACPVTYQHKETANQGTEETDRR